MLRLTFITPTALALLVLLPFIWAFALLTPSRTALWRLWAGLVLRTLMLLALIGALAGTQFVRPVRDLTTVFLLDASDSVAPTQRERAATYINDALRTMPQGSQAAVVVFGENALVERAPSFTAALSRIDSVPVATRTNIQDAVQMGLALLPADTQQRLVLLSDGGENDGRAADAAQLAAVRHVPLDVVPLPGERGPDVVLSALDAPITARENQDIVVNVVVTSSFATRGQLRILADGQLVATQDTALQAGTNTIPVRIPAGKAGFRRLEAQLDAQGDAEPQNNRAAAFTSVQGPPQILVIAGDPSQATNLRNALLAAGVRVDVLVPDNVPATLPQLGNYAGVILFDTPANTMPRPLLNVLPAYVRDLGRGFAMVGGPNSFGAGGYRRTPLEELLPVNLDPRDTTKTPDVALVMVIDRSGSMDEANASGRTKLDLAKEAVYQAALGLSQRDQIGLVVFDDKADWVVPLRKLPSAIEIEQALSTFNSGGGTNIRPGIEQAAQALATATAKIKHVILLTDGEANSNYGDLVDQMHAEGITISTVAIGSSANPNLAGIAQRGGGTSYRVENASQVPNIFLQETVKIAGRDIVEGQFTTKVGSQTAFIGSFPGFPSVQGYNGTEIKDTARQILETSDDKPLLAQWQFGLGRAVAWTTDMQGTWAKDWVTWNQFPRFVSGLVDLMVPSQAASQQDANQLSVQTTTNGAQTSLDLAAQNAQGQPQNGLALQGRLTDPENAGATLNFVQVEPGRYRATANTAMPGVYLAQIVASNNDQPFGAVTTGVVVSYSPEYGAQRENIPLLNDLARFTDGRIDPPATAIFAPTTQNVGAITEIALPLLWLALLLLPFDIAVRRLFVRRTDIASSLEARRQIRAQPVREAEATMARLSAAKRRADVGARREEPGGRSQEGGARSSAALNPQSLAPNPQPPIPISQQPAPSITPVAADDDAMARLRAAKQRARSKHE